MNSDFEMVRPLQGLSTQIYMLGDVFHKDVYLGLQSIYRAWHVQLPSVNMGRRELACKISFRYGLATGSWVLILNGQVKAIYQGKVSDGPFDLAFKIADQNFVLTAERHNSPKFKLRLKMNGYDLTEIRKTAEISVGEMVPSKVSIVDVRQRPVEGKDVTFYRICCEVFTGEQVFAERRYQEFVMLSNIVRGHTAKHLRGTLPSLPGKVFNPFYDQSQTEFIRCRKIALQQYLVDVLANAKVCLYSEVLCFLGLDPCSGHPLDIIPTAYSNSTTGMSATGMGNDYSPYSATGAHAGGAGLGNDSFGSLGHISSQSSSTPSSPSPSPGSRGKPSGQSRDLSPTVADSAGRTSGTVFKGSPSPATSRAGSNPPKHIASPAVVGGSDRGGGSVVPREADSFISVQMDEDDM